MAGTYSKTSKTKSASVDTLKTKFTDADEREWASAVKTVPRQAVDEVPDGWYTTSELCQLFKVSASTAYRMLCSLSAAGKVEMRKFRIASMQHTYTTPHFKLKK